MVHYYTFNGKYSWAYCWKVGFLSMKSILSYFGLWVYIAENFFRDWCANFRERVLNTKSGFVFLGFIYTRVRCSPMVLRHLGLEC